MVSTNLHRWHLNESQRAMVAAKIANLGHGGDRKSDQAENLPLELPSQAITQAAAAELLSVSDRAIRSARTVQRGAVRELAATVESGAVSVSAAADVARLPAAEQVEPRFGGFNSFARRSERLTGECMWENTHHS